MPENGNDRTCGVRRPRDRPRAVAVPRPGFSRSDSRQRPHPLSRVRLNALLAAGLAALTIAVYASVGGLEFLNYDDNVYVVDDARVSAGLTGDNARWSLTAFENGNWHPLTLLSHMLDVQVFGLDAGAHHWMNLALHVANVLLLFWLLAGTTSQRWPSLLVAGLFAVHPLNVQTVAWISERKSLLSTAFWMLALIAYARDRKSPAPGSFAATLVFATMALAAKPMAVTLPLTFWLLDRWPLRLRTSVKHIAPVAAAAFACGLLTVAAQRAADALQPVASYPLSFRLGNAVVSYGWYLMKTVWPAGLAAFYPHPLAGLSLAAVGISAAALILAAAAVAALGRSSPALSMGWWWYVGTLLPVAGIIQVGSQARADRYAYVPLIGIFIIAAWSAARLAAHGPGWRKGVAFAAVASVAALATVTRAQLPYWHDSVQLFQRAIDVVPGNAIAENNLGMALVERKDLAGALPHFRKAVELAPDDTDARSNLGNALRAVGRPGEAVGEYEQALERAPADPSIHYNLATALLDLGRTSEAVQQLKDGRESRPRLRKSATPAPARRSRLDETSSRRTIAPVEEPYDPEAARSQIVRILDGPGMTVFTKRAKDALMKNTMTSADAVNVLRGGRISKPVLSEAGWTYRAETARMRVEFSFRPDELVIESAWRTNR